jgi:hypothetical protein
MPIWGTGPKRTDEQTNFQIRATPTYVLPDRILGLSLWFDAADISTITTNISSLNQWQSKTPISTVMSNAQGLLGATWRSTTQNGLPVVRFNNSNSFMSSFRTNYPSSNFTTSNETTMFLAYNPTNNGAPFGVVDTGSYGAGGIRYHPQSGQIFFFGNIYTVPNNARLDYSYTVNTGFKVETYLGRQSTLSFRNNGTLFATSTMLTGLSFPDQNNVVLMGGLGYGLRPFTQDIGEALMYNRGLSDIEINSVEAYLAAKWGVRNSLPFNHPARVVGGPLMGYRFLPYTQVVSNYGLWFDAMDTSTIRDIGGNFPPLLPPNQLGIGRWNDKSANNRFLSNWVETPSGFNLFATNNYYPAVVQRFLPGNAFSPRFRSQDCNNYYTGCNISAFFVFSAQSNTFNDALLGFTSSFNAMPEPLTGNRLINNSNSTFDFTLTYNSSNIGLSRFGANTINNVVSAPYNGAYSLVSILVNGTQNTIGKVLPSTNVISINGAFVSSSSFYAGRNFNILYLSIFGGYNFTTRNTMSFNEIGIFYRTLTTPERVAYESQLIRKWGLPSNSPVTPLNQNPVTNGLYFNIDAYDQSLISTTLTSDGLRRVDTAFDKSGNNRNFKFTTGFSNIFYNRVSTMNQYNSLYFSTGSYSGILSNINPINTFSTNSYSLFLVYNQLSTNTTTRVFAANNQSGNDIGIGAFSYQLLNQTSFITPLNYQLAGANIINGCNYLYSLINNGGPTYDIYQTSTFYSYHNFGTGASLTCNINLASTNLLNISKFNIGGQIFGQNFCFNGLISEVILYNRGLSNSERLQVENYLINKWGISTLISNVPVTGGLNLWLDCYDPATIFFSTNTNQVTQWRDKSLCNFHMSNPGTLARSQMPTYTTAAPSGLPSLQFSNSAPATTFFTNLWNCNFRYPQTRETTLFVSYSSTSNSGFYGPLFTMLSNDEVFFNTGNGFGLEVLNFDGGIGLVRSSVRIYNTLIPNGHNITTLASVLFNSSFTTIPDIPQRSFGLSRNGVVGFVEPSSFISSVGTLSTQNFLVNQASLGTRGAGTTGDAQWYYSGFIHEVLQYNRALNFSERQQVESYLLSKWNI